MNWVWSETRRIDWCEIREGGLPRPPGTLYDDAAEFWDRYLSEPIIRVGRGLIAVIGWTEIGVARIENNLWAVAVRQAEEVSRRGRPGSWYLDEAETRAAVLAWCEANELRISGNTARQLQPELRREMREKLKQVRAGEPVRRVLWTHRIVAVQTYSGTVWACGEQRVKLLRHADLGDYWALREIAERRWGLKPKNEEELFTAAVVWSLRGLGK